MDENELGVDYNDLLDIKTKSFDISTVFIHLLKERFPEMNEKGVTISLNALALTIGKIIAQTCPKESQSEVCDMVKQTINFSIEIASDFDEKYKKC